MSLQQILPAATDAEAWQRVDQLNDEADAALMVSMHRTQELVGHALELAESSGYKAGAARARMLLGYSLYLLSNYAEASAAFEESMTLAASLGLTALEARSLNGLAITCVKVGRLGEGLEHHLRRLKIVQTLQDRLAQASTLNNIGTLFLELNEYATALPYHLEALELAIQIGHAVSISSASINAALDYHELGRFEEALALNRTTLQRAREAGYRQHEFLLLANMAANLLGLDHLDDALVAAEDAIRGSEELGDQENLCDALTIQGRVLARQGALDTARAVLERAVGLADELNLLARQADGHLHLSVVLEAQGAYREALGHARRAASADQTLMTDLLQRKTQVLATQLKVARLEHQAAEERIRNQELSHANTALQVAQEHLAYQAQHDALTGLVNRAAFEAELQHAVQGAETVGVLFIDLDHFKTVNDTLGHDVGDTLLIQVADRLRGAVREGDLVARQGGDEFTVLLRQVRTHDEAETAATRILAALEAPFDLAKRELVVTASIGVAVFPDDGTDVSTLQKNADLAMYVAKRERHTVRRFQTDQSTAAPERPEQGPD